MESRELGTIARGFHTLFNAGTTGALSDCQLLERFVRRSDHTAEAAFTALVERHGPMVLRVCFGVLHDTHAAEDAFQASFLILARKAHAIRDRESLASWLFGVARRVSCRARARRSQLLEREGQGLDLAGGRCLECADRRDFLPEVHDELDRLPAKYRVLIVLCYLEGLTHAEAAGQLRLPLGTVKVRLARGRRLLRDRLVRRGLAPIMTTAWMIGEARGQVSRQLVSESVRSAIEVASGRAAKVSESIASLVEGVLKMMMLSRLKTIAMLLTASFSFCLASAIAVSAFPPPARSGPIFSSPAAPDEVREVVATRIRRENFQRETTQAGTLEAAESVNLTPRFSGYLKVLEVDIGDPVRRGQVLAEIDAPELVAEKAKAQAVVELANARLGSAKTAVTVAEAAVNAAKAKAEAADAGVEGSEAQLRYREKTLNRMQGLAAQNAVDRRLVDEAEDHVAAVRSDRNSAKAQAVTARASIEEAKAKLAATKSDVGEAEANLQVARAEQAKALAIAGYTKIVSPWDGFVTKRGYHVGDYVRSGDAGGPGPVLTLIKAGKVRVIVDVPDMDAPYLDKGDRATVRIDALGGRTYQGKIARTALAQDPDSRTVRAEIDLDNEDGRLRPGQFGRVTINLQDHRNVLSIPASAILERSADGTALCYVVVDGRAVRTRIRVGEQNGDRVEVTEGVKEGDSVIANPAPEIQDRQRVIIKPGADNK